MVRLTSRCGNGACSFPWSGSRAGAAMGHAVFQAAERQMSAPVMLGPAVAQLRPLPQWQSEVMLGPAAAQLRPLPQWQSEVMLGPAVAQLRTLPQWQSEVMLGPVVAQLRTLPQWQSEVARLHVLANKFAAIASPFLATCIAGPCCPRLTSPFLATCIAVPCCPRQAPYQLLSS